MNTTQRATYYIITIILVAIALLLATVVEAKAKSKYVTIDDLQCIAVDPWGYGSEFGDMMRPCSKTASFLSIDRVVVSIPTKKDKTPVVTTPAPPTSTLEPTDTPVATDTPVVTAPPTSTPEPTKQKCNRGKGNGAEGCDPGNSGGKPGNAGEDNE